MEAPAPRLEFRWRKEPENELETERVKQNFFTEAYFCDYGLVMPLDKYDIRAEGEDGEFGVRTEKFYKFETTIFSGSVPEDGRVPFLDGAHSKWDSEALKGLPVWVKSLSGHHAPRPENKP